jgi:hypothetical protein
MAAGLAPYDQCTGARVDDSRIDLEYQSVSHSLGKENLARRGRERSYGPPSGPTVEMNTNQNSAATQALVF